MPISLFQSTLPVWGATHISKLAFMWSRFQSTLPVWGATRVTKLTHKAAEISIHAPRVGSDVARAGHDGVVLYFNPRSPCGERLHISKLAFMWSRFQSTLPVWGATRSVHGVGLHSLISIHAPRVGSDSKLA